MWNMLNTPTLFSRHHRDTDLHFIFFSLRNGSPNGPRPLFDISIRVPSSPKTFPHPCYSLRILRRHNRPSHRVLRCTNNDIINEIDYSALTLILIFNYCRL